MRTQRAKLGLSEGLLGNAREILARMAPSFEFRDVTNVASKSPEMVVEYRVRKANPAAVLGKTQRAEIKKM